MLVFIIFSKPSFVRGGIYFQFFNFHPSRQEATRRCSIARGAVSASRRRRRPVDSKFRLKLTTNEQRGLTDAHKCHRYLIA